jgi:hypothetical protein
VIRRRGIVSGRILLFAAVLSLAVVASAATALAAVPAPGWKILAATGPTNLPTVPGSETQRVAIRASGGTFTLTFQSQTTTPLAFDASPATIEAALNALSSIGGAGGSVVVTFGGEGGEKGGEHLSVVRFGGSLAGTDVSQMTIDGSLLTGVPQVSVTTLATGGVSGTLAAYATNVGGAPTTTATTSITVGPLPTGIVIAGLAGGTGWTCLPPGPDTVTCNRNDVTPAHSAIAPRPVEVPLRAESNAVASSSVPVTVTGGGAASSDTYMAEIKISNDPAPVGVQAFWAGTFDVDGKPATQAGGHPSVAGTMFMVNTNVASSGIVVPAGDPRDVVVDLPPGFIGNPMVTERCPRTESGSCSGLDTIVGDSKPLTSSFPPEITGSAFRVNNDVPPIGYAAQFNFPILDTRTAVLASVRSDQDFGVTAVAPNIVSVYKVYGSLVMLEGAPTDANGKAFLTNPTDCANEAAITPTTRISTNSWQAPSVFGDRIVNIPEVKNCSLLVFEPEFTFQPGSSSAAAPTGATAHLHVDQADLLDPAELAPPHLKDSVVTLPVGMNLNPSAADGLAACSTQQMGLKGTGFAMPNPVRFTMDPVTCPEASKIGTAEVDTPLLRNQTEGHVLQGTVYLAAQDDNPFKSLLAMYIVVEDEETGIVVKLPGKVTPDSATGQLTATFLNNPQVPFEDLTLKFRGGGPRSTLATPDVCAQYTTNGSFTPWSAPESGPASATTDSFAISSGVAGSASCPKTKAQRPFALGFEAGVINPAAGAHSPFTLRITRPDGNQELDKVTVSTPPGFAASLKGVGLCPEAALTAAATPSRTGKAELANSSCPASSQVGTTTIGAGVGSSPYYVKTGKVYLTGPYNEGPLGLAFVVPAVAGPFDLGVQVVRTSLRVNPQTAQITAVSDPIPQILKGIPLQIRDVRVDIDRPGFSLNPTNCEAMAVSGLVTGGSGAVASLSNRFQVGNCSALGFKPNLKIQLHGKTKRGAYQRVVATLTAREGDANISRAAVTFPHSAFLAQEHLDKICTRVQFAAKACPKRSIYGYATAITPLLDEPVQGPVYLRSNPEHELPDLVAALRGPDRLPIEVELQGRTDSKNEGIRNTFDIVPDVPVSKFTLQIKGGNHALIVNSRDLCKGKQRASVRFNAQNGKVRKFRPLVQNDCGKTPSK